MSLFFSCVVRAGDRFAVVVDWARLDMASPGISRLLITLSYVPGLEICLYYIGTRRMLSDTVAAHYHDHAVDSSVVITSQLSSATQLHDQKQTILTICTTVASLETRNPPRPLYASTTSIATYVGETGPTITEVHQDLCLLSRFPIHRFVSLKGLSTEANPHHFCGIRSSSSSPRQTNDAHPSSRRASPPAGMLPGCYTTPHPTTAAWHRPCRATAPQ